MELAGGGGDCQRGALQSMLSSGEAHSSEARPDWLLPLWRNFSVVWRGRQDPAQHDSRRQLNDASTVQAVRAVLDDDDE